MSVTFTKFSFILWSFDKREERKKKNTIELYGWQNNKNKKKMEKHKQITFHAIYFVFCIF